MSRETTPSFDLPAQVAEMLARYRALLAERG
jgi:hypothetical protein